VRRSFDFAGAITLTAGMLLLVRTIVEAPDAGWGDPATIGGIVLAALLLGTFVGIERRSANPLVRLGILRSAPLLRANVGMMTMFGAYIGFQFVGTLYLQSVLGWSPLETALAFLPGGLIVAFGSPRLGPLVDRYGTARIIVAGSLAFLVGYALFLRIGDSFSYTGIFLPTMLLIGVGFGLSFPAFNMQATAGIANEEQGLASGLVNTSLQVGGARGLAISSAVISANSGGATQGEALLDGFQPAIAVVTAIAALGLVAALTGTRLVRARRPKLAFATAQAESEPLPERDAA
jgi:predicted MFS family arabinose efflux permease